MKIELPQVGFEPTTLCTQDRCSYLRVHVHVCKISIHYFPIELQYNHVLIS